ncbi:MAG: cytochrome [Cyanobacteria bacterium P01_E01_bin.6]
MAKIIIGVMGPGNGASPQDCQNAFVLGQKIAQAGWVLLTGGRNEGVMDAASRGAQQANGLVVGILPGSDTRFAQANSCTALSEAVDIPIITGMGHARNVINVLSSRVVIACGMGLGTASEVALALKSDIPVILLSTDQGAEAFFRQVLGKEKGDRLLHRAETPEGAIALVHPYL